MKKCDTCCFSKTPDTTMWCHHAPGPAVMINNRLTVCAEYQQESALEQFLDMIPALEQLMPETISASAYEDSDAYWSACELKEHLAYNTYVMYQIKGYPVTEKMRDYLQLHQSKYPGYHADVEYHG